MIASTKKDSTDGCKYNPDGSKNCTVEVKGESQPLEIPDWDRFDASVGGDGITSKRVYEQAVEYDGFSQMKSRQGVYWGEDIGFTENYTNSRISQADAVWDSAGNIISTGHIESVYDFSDNNFDAAGRLNGNLHSEKRQWGSYLNRIVQNKTETGFDGDGHPCIEKRGNRNFNMTDTPPELVLSPYRFQVWSSVLRQSVTTVGPDGAKKTTRVFAGGAVIANQSQYISGGQVYESIGWQTADPVTGSTVSFSYASYGNYSGVGHTEPFGQEVAGADPFYEPVEPSVTEPGPVYQASEPEWQCQIPWDFLGGFQGLPHHCQMRVLQDFSRGLDEIFGFTNPHNPNIPPRITTIYVGAPGSAAHEALQVPGVDANAGNSTINTMLVTLLQPTSKPHAEASDGPVQPASVPCEDGDFVICTSVSHSPDNPDWNRFDASVGVPQRDCNQEAGLSGFDAVPKEAAADVIFTAADRAKFSAAALATTWRFEGQFYFRDGSLKLEAEPNVKDQNGNVKKDPMDWDYGPFQLNRRFVEKYQNNKYAPYKLSDYPLAFGELGASKFNGSLVQNAMLAAAFMKANGGSLDNQIKHYAPEPEKRLQLWKTYGPKYEAFFNCWRALRSGG